MSKYCTICSRCTIITIDRIYTEITLKNGDLFEMNVKN